LFPVCGKREYGASSLSDPGHTPFSELSAALVSALEPGLSKTDQLGESGKLAGNLRQKDISLAEITGQILRENTDTQRLLLIADQFEEIYTLCQEENERNAFLNALLEPAKTQSQNREPALNLIITLRADFMSQALSYRPFADALQHADIKLGPMNTRELQLAVEEPARKSGVGLENGLTKIILDAVRDEPGNLPLLEFLLTRLWEEREGNRLTHSAYRKVGGVEKSLADYAEKVYERLATEAAREQTRHIFLQLIRPGEGTEDTRRPATMTELGEENRELITHLANKRLIVTDRDENNGTETVEVVHKTLIREWDRLREWMGKDRDFRIWQERLRSAIDQWEDKGKDDGGLLRGAFLAEAEGWLEQRPESLGIAEKEFIRTSLDRKRSDRDQPTLFALWRQAEEQRKIAFSRQLANQSASYLEEQFDLALLLSVEAYQVCDTLEARSSVLNALLHNPHLVRFLRGHSDKVWSVAFSPDGRILASGSADKTVILWNANAHRQTGLPLRGHEDAVFSVAFSRDHKILASGSADKRIILWNISARQQIGEPLRGHNGTVLCVAFSPDGKVLASGSSDKTIILWDTTIWQPIGKPLRGHTSRVESVAFSPDSKILASGSSDKRTILWDAATCQRIDQLLKEPPTSVESVAFSPDGKTLASTSRDRTILWDTTTWQQTDELLRAGGYGFVFSPDSKMAASTSGDRIIIWDVVDQPRVSKQQLKGHGDIVTNVAFSPDNRISASASRDNNIILWNVTAKQQICQPLRGHRMAAYSVAFSPDGKILASGSWDNTIILWDVNNSQQIGSPLRGHKKNVFSIAFSPDGKILASASQDRTIILWNTANRQRIGKPLKEHKRSVHSVAFSPDGKMLASASWDDTIIFWDVAGRQRIGESLKGHERSVYDAVFSLDGNILASAGWDGTVILWNVNDRQQIGSPLKGHQTEVNSVAFSPDGKMLASGSADKCVILWDVFSRQRIGRPLTGHEGEISDVVFSPDGKMLASAGSDHTVMLWDASPESWIARACRIANRSLTREERKQFMGDEAYR